jgi:hypothetical protein
MDAVYHWPSAWYPLIPLKTRWFQSHPWQMQVVTSMDKMRSGYMHTPARPRTH